VAANEYAACHAWLVYEYVGASAAGAAVVAHVAVSAVVAA
jgi:hypothetical protein